MTTSGIRAADGGRASFVSSIGRAVAALLLAVFVSGCAITNSHVSTNGVPTPGSSPKVLVMVPDVELYVFTAGGLNETNAEWTATAKGHVDTALAEILESMSVSAVDYEVVQDVGPESLAEAQVLKLHEAVGAAIIDHKYSIYPLPTKEDSFDWGLGEGVTGLKEKYDADYVLFVYLRDSFSSGGRVALNILTAVIGAGVKGGVQSGYASLIDLNSGDVVWFNSLVNNVGDLRTPEGSKAATLDLLEEAPL